jgi:hypothetical protein
MVSLSTRILPGRGVGPDFGIETLLGPACILGGSTTSVVPGVNVGGGVALICFNCAPHSITSAIASLAVLGATFGAGILGVALANAKAVGILAGMSAGVNVGLSLNVGRIGRGS